MKATAAVLPLFSEIKESVVKNALLKDSSTESPLSSSFSKF
jgi:hypothetical protein